MITCKHSYEIERTLVVSTGHIEKSDAEMLESWVMRSRDAYWVQLLTEDPNDDLLLHDYEYGWILRWGDVPDARLKQLTFSDALIGLMHIAVALGCDLRLDQDGPTYDHLPVYDW